jgi:hypothetical protein
MLGDVGWWVGRWFAGNGWPFCLWVSGVEPGEVLGAQVEVGGLG